MAVCGSLPLAFDNVLGVKKWHALSTLSRGTAVGVFCWMNLQWKKEGAVMAGRAAGRLGRMGRRTPTELQLIVLFPCDWMHSCLS